VPATSASSSKGIFVAATNTTNKTDKTGGSINNSSVYFLMSAENGENKINTFILTYERFYKAWVFDPGKPLEASVI
jgi:hypothetical protein